MNRITIRKTLFCLLLCFCSLGIFAQPVGWNHAVPVQISDTGGVDQYNFQVSFRMNTQVLISNGQLQSDADDIRVAWNCDGTDTIPFYIQNYVNTDSTQIWVKIDTLLANANETFFVFYGNNAAPRTSTPYIFGNPQSSTDSVVPASTNNVVSNSQRGFMFTPTVNLLMAHIGKREPTGTTRYVTLFNTNTQAIVAQGQVSGPAGQYSYTELINGGVWLQAGTSYIHTLYQGNGDGYYFGSSTQIGQHMTYGGAMRYCNSCTQNTFPTSSLANYHYGVSDFWYFLRTAPANEPTITIGTALMASVPGDTGLCPADTVMLAGTATGGDGNYTYVWNSNYNIATDTMGNAYVYPDTAYSYTMTVMDGYGCMSTDEVMVTPVIFSISSASTDATCSNIADGTGMVTPSGTGPFMYDWSTGDTTDQVSGLMPGNYVVEVVDSNGCELEDTLVVGFINQAPTPNLGPDQTVCSDVLPIVLNAGAANSYMWQDGSTNQTFTVTATGTYSVVAMDSFCSGSDSVMITVNASPTVSVTAALNQVCNNDAAIALTTSPSGGTLSGTGVTGSQFDPSGLAGGTYSITYAYTDGNGCGGNDTTDITVNETPTSDFLASTNMLSANFTDNSVGASQWSWTFGDGNVSTQQNPTHTYAGNGSYQVCLTVTSNEGCVDEFCDSVTVNEVSIANALAGNLEVYPNPANGQLNIRQDGSLAGTFAVEIYNLQGQKLAEITWNTKEMAVFSTSVAQLPTGSYLLRVAGTQGQLTQQFMINR